MTRVGYAADNQLQRADAPAAVYMIFACESQLWTKTKINENDIVRRLMMGKED